MNVNAQKIIAGEILPKTEITEVMRDALQGYGINDNVNPIRLTRLCKEICSFVDHLEAGYIGANKLSNILIKELLKNKSTKQKIMVFGRASMTHAKKIAETGCEIASIYAKSHLLHLPDIGMEEKKYLQTLKKVVKYLKNKGIRVFFDLEHAVDAFYSKTEFGEILDNEQKQKTKKYLFEMIQTVINAGADRIIACDTNGGSMPWEISELFDELTSKWPEVKFGFHGHNNAGMAVANSIIAVKHGAIQIQGTMNGDGEGSGNANLSTIISNLALKMQIPILQTTKLQKLKLLCNKYASVFQAEVPSNTPYVGEHAFATNSGDHVSAINRRTGAYLHVHPENIGNRMIIGTNRQSGIANITHLAEKAGIPLDKNQARKLINQNSTALEHGGFKHGESSFLLACLRAKGKFKELFEFESCKLTTVITKKGEAKHEATIKITFPDKKTTHEAAEGNGPYNAIAKALIKALLKKYPFILKIKLTSFWLSAYEVGEKGSSAPVRVVMRHSVNGTGIRTIGVHPSSTQASLNALLDAYQCAIQQLGQPKAKKKKTL